MTRQDLIGVSDYDEDSVDGWLELWEPYIVAQAEEMAYSSSNFAHPAVLDLEIDEIVQNVRIKLWKALENKHIEYPKAYIKRMVRNEFIDFLRRRKLLLPLPTDEEGELFQGRVLVRPSEGLSDPADEFEGKWAVANRIDQAIDAISALPARQKHATICSLRERVDNLVQLIDAFERHRMKIDSVGWPDDPADVRRLKGSLSAARRTIAQRMFEEILLNEERGVAQVTPPSCIYDDEAASP